MEHLQFFKAFAILLLITYCESGPVEFVTDDSVTTLCPEELAKRKLESSIVAESPTLQIENEDLPSEGENDLGKIPTSTGVADGTTTICPEELERRKLEELANENPQKTEDDRLEELDSEQEDKENAGSTENQEETTTICPEEEKKKLDQVQEKLNEMAEKADDLDKGEDLETFSEITTLCPEEMEKMKQENENLNEIFDNEDNSQKSYVVFDKDNVNLEENSGDDSITGPKELARRKLEQSQKYLTKFKELVDKAQQGKRRRRQAADYSYYVNQPAYNTQGVAVASTSNGASQQQSSYDTLGYNVQGQAASSSLVSSTNQNQPSYSQHNQQRYSQQNQPQTYNSQTYSPLAIKTYQQIRKQYQPANTNQKNPSFYPKTYQNNAKPAKMYRNPSTYVRYPSNGNLNNYYRVNSVGNRRQFQGARPFASTSARPNVRVTRKKKFKPSPVFA